MNMKNKPFENIHKSQIYLKVLILKLLIAILVNYTACSFFIKGSHSHMKNNTVYLDTPVTFERVGIFVCGFQQTYPMDILFQQTKNKWVEKNLCL